MSENPVPGLRRLEMQSLFLERYAMLPSYAIAFRIQVHTPLPVVWHLSSVESTELLRLPYEASLPR